MPATGHLKVLYDEYTGKFYREENIDSIERRCAYYQKQAAVKNKCFQRQLAEKFEKYKTKNLIFEMKLSRAETMMKKSLQDLWAYSQVLQGISSKNRLDRSYNVNLGSYGSGNVYKELLPKIAHEKFRLTESYIQKKEVSKYKRQRKRLSIFDSNTTLEDLYRRWDQQKQIVFVNCGVITVRRKDIKSAKNKFRIDNISDNGKEYNENKETNVALPPL